MAATTSASRAGGSSLLRLALEINGVFSVLAGAGCVVAAGRLAPMFGMAEPLVFVFLGLAIVAFGGIVLFTALRGAVTRSFGVTILAMDVLWVIASFVILFAGLLPLTDGGRWLLVAQAVVVALIAELEFFGLRRLDADPNTL